MRPPAIGIAIVALAFALVTLICGLYFLAHWVGTAKSCYYNCFDWDSGARRRDWKRLPPASPGSGATVSPLSSYWLPVVAICGMLLCRLFDVFPSDWPWQQDYLPTMTLPVIMFAMTLWLCFFGWLSMVEVRQSIPWVGVLIVLIGLFGHFGWTDNHLVWPEIEAKPVGDMAAKEAAFYSTGTFRMFGFTVMLAFLVICIYAWTMHAAGAVSRLAHARECMMWCLRPRAWGPLAVLLVAVGLVLYWADEAATSRPPAKTERTNPDARARVADENGVVPPPPPPRVSRPDLDFALAAWLEQVCNAKDPKAPCTPRIAASEGGGYEVYFVSTEGGGIRAAVWTAFTLQRFAEVDRDFRARTFSISGVSGGAVGAAAFRACTLGKRSERAECLEDFARTDLLAPLLSAWMFEDLVARVLPTSRAIHQPAGSCPVEHGSSRQWRRPRPAFARASLRAAASGCPMGRCAISRTCF